MTRIMLLVAYCFVVQSAVGQDLVISNGRIIDGTGAVIERGNIVVRDGRIESVTAGEIGASGARIDASGLTVIPGLIDTHRHDLTNTQFFNLESDDQLVNAVRSGTAGKLRSLLEEGYTTIMVPGGPLLVAAETRALLERGDVAGPDVLFAGPTLTAPGDHPAAGPVCRGAPYCRSVVAAEVDEPGEAREAVRINAEADIDAIKAIIDLSLIPETSLNYDVLSAAIDEAHDRGMRVFVHAELVDTMIEAVKRGADRLVHTPMDRLISEGNGAQLLREGDVPIATTLSFRSPEFAAATGGQPLTAELEVLLQNIRHLWDEGVTVAFGTDSPPMIRPMVEIVNLARVLSPEEVLTALTRNAAIYLSLEDEIGTLERGKVADIVIVDGDPLVDVTNLGNIEVVIKNGRVVVDNR